MTFLQVERLVEEIASIDASFPQKIDTLESRIGDLSFDELHEHLLFGGVIPESYGHDSTAEKLFAKYSDSLVAKALAEVGFEAMVVDERADAADVSARCDAFSLVADSKAFRLSRTAKNQKDFKVEALNSWRGTANFALLVAPFYQYPSSNSQIYSQAIRYNVTLFSFAHLVLILRSRFHTPNDLRPVFEISGSMGSGHSAIDYWSRLQSTLNDVLNTKPQAWDEVKKERIDRLRDQGTAQLKYWEGVKEDLQGLTKEQAIRELIDSRKIDSKIQTIVRAADIR